MSERCRQYDEQISAYLDGELSEADAAALRAHTAACPDCAMLLDLLGGLSCALQDDLAEPPAALSAGVMGRIYAWEEAHPSEEKRSAAEPIPISRARETERARSLNASSKPSARKSSHTGRILAAAACFILVVGAGAYFGINGMNRLWKESTDRSKESITLESYAAAEKAPESKPESKEEMILDSSAAFAAPAPDAGQQPVERSFTAANDAAEPQAELFAAPMEDAADEPAAEAMDGLTEETAEDVAETETVAGGSLTFEQGTFAAARYTLEHPAQVPEGKEEAFEDLLHSSETPDDVDRDALTSIAAVEYKGVLYEFFEDEEDGRLFWMDAAESEYPLPADGTADDLWDIIG